MYLNGQFVPESRATVSILDRGFQGGEGVYDVGRTYGHKAFRLRRHVDRLFWSLRYTRIEIEETPDPDEAIAHEVLERNRPLLGEWDEYALWFNVSRGVAVAAHRRPQGAAHGGRLLSPHRVPGLRSLLPGRRPADGDLGAPDAAREPGSCGPRSPTR